MNTIKKMDLMFKARTAIEIISFILAIWGVAEGSGIVFWFSCVVASLIAFNYSAAFIVRYILFPDLSREINKLGRAMVDDMTPSEQ
jgi:hypothetical protein